MLVGGQTLDRAPSTLEVFGHAVQVENFDYELYICIID